MVKVCS